MSFTNLYGEDYKRSWKTMNSRDFSSTADKCPVCNWSPIHEAAVVATPVLVPSKNVCLTQINLYKKDCEAEKGTATQWKFLRM